MVSSLPSTTTPPTTSPTLHQTPPSQLTHSQPQTPQLKDNSESTPCPLPKLVDDFENDSHGSSVMHAPTPMTTKDRFKHFNGMLVFFMMYVGLQEYRDARLIHVDIWLCALSTMALMSAPLAAFRACRALPNASATTAIRRRNIPYPDGSFPS